MDVVWLSRLQFAVTIMFHYLFPPLTIGMGVVMVCLRMGGLISPPLGNSLAGIAPAYPFFLWAAMAGLGLIFLHLVGEEKN